VPKFIVGAQADACPGGHKRMLAPGGHKWMLAPVCVVKVIYFIEAASICKELLLLQQQTIGVPQYTG